MQSEPSNGREFAFSIYEQLCCNFGVHRAGLYLLELKDPGSRRLPGLFYTLRKADQSLNVVIQPRRANECSNALPELKQSFRNHTAQDFVGSCPADQKPLCNLSFCEELVPFSEFAIGQQLAENLAQLLIHGRANQPFCVSGWHS